ncbi:NADPH-dependent F420 reductase [Alcaligenaceae bacterium]|nr:NADPH-dependent F420 reductase [Alcaligenaceae bacterium]
MDKQLPVIAVLGGTGALGFGLVLRWALAGYPVVIGSRSLESAQDAAERARAILAERGVRAEVGGLTNAEAAAKGQLVAVTVPYAQQQAILSAVAPALAGKIVIDTTVPLMPPRVGTVQLPAGGSSAVAAQALLGDTVRLVSAFQNVAADKLQGLEPLDCDILVTGNDKEACTAVIELVRQAGMRGYYAGPLANAAAAEALTSVLITINRQFKCQAGIQITGIA